MLSRLINGFIVFLICGLGVGLGGCSPSQPTPRAVLTVDLDEAAAAPVPAKPAAPAPKPAASSDYAVVAPLVLDRPLRHGDYTWNEEGAPAAPVTVVIDLGTQVLHVYRAGVEIGRAAILYGATDKPTPTGTFPILQKKKHHVSTLYDAPMPFMQRLTWDGVAIHASTVEYGSATHGCIGVPKEFAEHLFGLTKLGDTVIVRG